MNLSVLITPVFILLFVYIYSYKKLQNIRKKEFLRCAKVAHYERNPLLNASEFSVYHSFNKLFLERNFIFSQVPQREILSTDENEDATFQAVNCKRCDFLITNQNFDAIPVIEVQDMGHQLDETSNIRDKIKYFAVENVGIQYVEIFHHELKCIDATLKEKFKHLSFSSMSLKCL